MDEVTEAVGISGKVPVSRGACLRVLTVVCEGMTPQSDLWISWRENSRASPLTQNHLACTVSNAGTNGAKVVGVEESASSGDKRARTRCIRGTRNATYRIVHADNQR